MSDLQDLHELLDGFAAGTLETDQSKLEDLRGRLLYLYGAGNVGKRLFHNLRANGITVAGFIDRNPAVTLSGIDAPIHLPDDPALAPAHNDCTIILSGLFPLKVCQDIKAALAALGFRHVHALHEVNFNQVNSGAFRETLFDDSYNKVDILGSDRRKLEHAFGLLQGDSDRALFLRYLKAHLTMDFTRLDEPLDIALQYLAHDIPETKDYSRFVDCGGYDGDTFRQLTAQGCPIRSLAVFEPQTDLYRKYAATVQAHPARPEQAFLFPCGVYSETTQLRFATNAEAQSAARVSASGDSVIQCICLDDALQGFAPTFIKMDIEGAETAALKGARGLIQHYGPALAICVYHGLSDLWEIPCLIDSMRSDYRYYLRNYNYLGLETVLYAFPSSSE
ncbi:MAG: FkbM family methyltransferase [Candidatus Competibacteraceae bacterium]|nr:FkbM family methyltransferase [Candidatus Competibacteraceae bacterium]